MTLELQKQQQQTAKHSKVHLNISSKYKVIIFYPKEKVKIQNCFPWNCNPETEIQSQLILKYREKNSNSQNPVDHNDSW